MGYGWVYVVGDALPLIGLAGLAAVLFFALRLVMPSRLRRFALALGIVLALTAVPIWLEARDRQADLARMADYEIAEFPTDLPPGRVLWLESDVAPCGYACPDLTLAPWAASVTRDEDVLNSGDFFAFDGVYLQDVVWPRLDRAAPLPYDYLLVSASVYRLPGIGDTGLPPEWPDSLQSVILLVQLYGDGWVDLSAQDVLYRRFVHLHRVSQYPFWPHIKTSRTSPEVVDIIADMLRLPAASE